ncbi:hypothetical protein [Hymenobacter sp. PAMC 26628]|uniref:hypothetical protein n=1 Tax=Hymenobacter sp. PAMC 26628 TaxID=1484118 RepID=UPI00077035E1|nr:hypothetical protein [Hymenobacter sp. PAMC 26628]AMJ67883.1 hypothetical protein AXW84_22520 [Hymenobacter sp. PAMC 26628]
MKNLFPALVFLLVATGCNSSAPSDKTAAGSPAAKAAAPNDTLQQAVAKYVAAHAAAFPGYEPVRWGAPAAYTKINEAAVKGVVAMQAFDDALTPRNQALANYKASLARHDAPAKTAAIMALYGKANKHNDSLLVIANSFIGVKDSARLGTQLVHAYRAQNKAGALVLDSATFVVYPGGRVEQL